MPLRLRMQLNNCMYDTGLSEVIWFDLELSDWYGMWCSGSEL